jgi:type IV pilus assembly protein PilQ
MKIPNKVIWFLLGPIMLLMVSRIAHTENRMPASFVEKRFSVNFKDSEFKDVFKLLGQQGDVNIQVDETLQGKVSYSFADVTLEGALRQIAKDHNLSIYMENGKIYVEKGDTPDATGATASSGHDDPGAGGVQVYTIKIHNSSAKYISEKIPKIMKNNESLVLDDTNNNLIFYGGLSTYQKIMKFVTAFDLIPMQILIEAQIIETSKNFSRDLGMQFGQPDTGPGYINAPGPSGTQNLTAKLLLGWIDSNTIDAKLQASESAGETRTISRPKMITMNNTPATINSGITYSIRTQASTASTTTGSTTTTSAAGGVQSVTAGLQLQVQPLILGQNLVRLQVNLTNSDADKGAGVDSIPAVVNNSANTSVIVRDGNTAVVAGLIKNNISKNSSGAPFLSHIPVIGWLFKTHSDLDNSKELVVLIKPKLISPDMVTSGQMRDMRSPETEFVELPKSAGARQPASVPKDK